MSYISIDVAAQTVSLSHWTIRRALKAGEIPFSRVGGRRVIRIALSDLDAWMAKHREGADPQSAQA